jgi:hypothetical protein
MVKWWRITETRYLSKERRPGIVYMQMVSLRQEHSSSLVKRKEGKAQVLKDFKGSKQD